MRHKLPGPRRGASVAPGPTHAASAKLGLDSNPGVQLARARIQPARLRTRIHRSTPPNSICSMNSQRRHRSALSRRSPAAITGCVLPAAVPPHTLLSSHTHTKKHTLSCNTYEIYAQVNYGADAPPRNPDHPANMPILHSTPFRPPRSPLIIHPAVSSCWLTNSHGQWTTPTRTRPASPTHPGICRPSTLLLHAPQLPRGFSITTNSAAAERRPQGL